MFNRSTIATFFAISTAIAWTAGCSTTPPETSPRTHAMEIAEKVFVQYAEQRANEAVRQKQYELAATYYERALRVDPDNERLRRGMEVAEMESKKLTAPSSLLDRYVQELELRRQAVLNETESWLHRARQAEAAGDFDEARDYSAQAMMTLQRNEELF